MGQHVYLNLLPSSRILALTQLGAMREVVNGSSVCTWTTQGTCDGVLGTSKVAEGAKISGSAAGQKWPPRRQNMHLGCKYRC